MKDTAALNSTSSKLITWLSSVGKSGLPGKNEVWIAIVKGPKGEDQPLPAQVIEPFSKPLQPCLWREKEQDAAPPQQSDSEFMVTRRTAV